MRTNQYYQTKIHNNMKRFKFKYFMLSLSLLLGCAPFFNSCDEVENAFEASTIKGVYQNIGRVYDNIRTIRWLNLEHKDIMH